MVHHFVEAHGHGLGQRTDFRKTVGDELQPLHVLVHFGNQRVVGIGFAQHFCPRHQARNRCSELVGSFFRESDPNLVLFGAFRGQKGENRNDHKQQNYAQLYVGIDCQPLENQRVVVANLDVVRVAFVVDADANTPSFGLHTLADLGDGLQAVRGVQFLHVDVAKHLHFTIFVHHHDGNRRVVFDDLQHKVHARIFIIGAQRVHRLGPDFHFFVLFFIEVARQNVRHDKRCHGNQNCHDHQQNLHLSNSVSPLHTLI